MNRTTAHIVIVGGSAAGLTVAALLRKKVPTLKVTLIEPSETHYYQPGFTIVGGGVYRFEQTARPTAKFIPSGVNRVRAHVTSIDVGLNQVVTANGQTVVYSHLVVCPGLVNDLDRVPGLADAMGHDGVTSNHVVESVRYTWSLIDAWKGGCALFTQPPLPFKCPGAPQKIAYLAADRRRQRGLLKSSELHFLTAGGAMFGIPEFAKALDKVIARYGIQPHFLNNLVAVDGKRKVATFEQTQGDQKSRVDYEYDLLHATPHQGPPGFLRSAPSLVNAAGYVEVNRGTLQHVRLGNVFSVGDACSTPNSKTAAAVRKQAPIMVTNLLAVIDGRMPEQRYDGYGSCPLATSLSTAMLAEFVYGGEITPSFRMDPFAEKRMWWWGKLYGFPALYWRMLKGLEFDVAHSADKATPFM